MSIEIVEISQKSIGGNVLLSPILRKLQVAEILNSKVRGEEEIPYGTIAEIIILSRFSKERVPMYHLQTFCQKNGLDTLYEVDSKKLNDDRVARCLDAMFPSISEMKTALVLSAIKTFNLNVSQIHTDITNILFEGSYEDQKEGDLQITYGYTKKGQDSRCKQVNFSLSVTADGGVPLWYQALDGNRADTVCYQPHLEAFQKELGITSPLIVGDSKLVSNSNMIAFCGACAFFIGPATLDAKEKKRLKNLWKQGVAFEALPLKAEGTTAIPYWGIETERELRDKKRRKSYLIRHLYIFSMERREVIRHTRAKNFLKAKKALHKIRHSLNKYDYKTEMVIHSRIQNQVLSKCPYYRIQLSKDSEGLFAISFSIDWEQLAEDELFDGIYVLRTNLPKEQNSMLAVLSSYKEQSHIERCFSMIKQPPIQVSPVWLHKPKRIESLLFLVFVAILVMFLLQREARAKVWAKKIPLRPAGRDDLPLTAKVLLSAFDSIAFVTVTFLLDGRLWTEQKCTRLSVSQKEVLFALSFPFPDQFLK